MTIDSCFSVLVATWYLKIQQLFKIWENNMFGKFRTFFCDVLQMGWFVEVKFQDMEWLESNCLDVSYPTDLETKAALEFLPAQLEASEV